jgi:hypothetical protein
MMRLSAQIVAAAAGESSGGAPVGLAVASRASRAVAGSSGPSYILDTMLQPW